VTKLVEYEEHKMIRTIKTNRMHYLLSIYFSNLPLHVSSRLTANHQEVLLCIYSSWYMSCLYIDWLLVGSGWNCIYRVVPSDDEQ